MTQSESNSGIDNQPDRPTEIVKLTFLRFLRNENMKIMILFSLVTAVISQVIFRHLHKIIYFWTKRVCKKSQVH